MRRSLTISVSLLLAIALLAMNVASALGYTVLKDSGTHGGWYFYDDVDTPGGVCGYGAADSSGTAYLHWLKAKAPFIYARNITPDVDHQKVSWQVKIQRSTDGGSTWKTIKSATAQTATAYDDHPASFSVKKYYVTGHASESYRALSVLRWYRAGSVEGLVKLVVEYYGAKWTVGSPDFKFSPPDECWGQAD